LRKGIVAKSSEGSLPIANSRAYPKAASDDEMDEQSEEEEQPEPVKTFDVAATFDEIVVWGHDQLPAADDTFVKGVEEWIAFAEAIHLPTPNIDDKAKERAHT
jgi:ribonuclease H2 subunit C